MKNSLDIYGGWEVETTDKSFKQIQDEFLQVNNHLGQVYTKWAHHEWFTINKKLYYATPNYAYQERTPKGSRSYIHNCIMRLETKEQLDLRYEVAGVFHNEK